MNVWNVVNWIRAQGRNPQIIIKLLVMMIDHTIADLELFI